MTTPEQAPADQVREALKPFAESVEYIDLLGADDDDYVVCPPLKAGDYRRAARILSALSAPAVPVDATPGDGERGAVVAWLRDPGGRWPRATAHAQQLADAIERGDHRASDAGER